jgi:hypothetical protein
MRLRAHALVGLAALGMGLGYAPSAKADVTAWAHVAGGSMGWKGGPDGELTASAMMAIDAGLGTSPRAPWIFGGYFRVMPVFGEGADLALMARFASRGFQTDLIGFAIDAGAYQRFWGADSTGFFGQAVLGLPLGFQLAGFGMGGSNETYGFGGTLGIDLVRLTVDRRHLLDWWPNPRPNDNMYKSTSGAAPSFFRF